MYFTKVGTVDSCRDVCEQGQVLLQECVPTHFDEIRPGKVRGTRSSITLEDIKQLREASQTSPVHGRRKDISFHQQQPRIFTSNSHVPHGWHMGLPAKVWDHNDDTRKLYDLGVKAVFRRVVFFRIKTNIIPEALRRAYRK